MLPMSVANLPSSPINQEQKPLTELCKRLMQIRGKGVEGNLRVWESRTTEHKPTAKGIAVDLAETLGPKTHRWGMDWYLTETLYEHDPIPTTSDV